MLVGCSVTNHYADAYDYQPFVNCSENAKGFMIEHWESYSPEIAPEHWFAWKYESSKYLKAADITDKCKDYLKSHNYWVDPIKIPFPENIKYPWGQSNAGIDYHRKIYQRKDKTMGFEKINFIVSLKPIVVITVPSLIEYWEKEVFFFPEEDRALPLNKRNRYYVLLKDGFAYGNRIPYNTDLTWFSPDMDITPRPVGLVSDSQGIIKIPCGNIMITQQDDEWVVSIEDN